MRVFFTTYIEPLSFFIFAVSLIFYSRKANSAFRFKVLYVFYLIGFIVLSGMAYTFKSGNSSTTYFYNLIYIISSLFLSYYFYLLFESRLKKIISVLAGLTTLIYYSLHTDALYFDSMGYVILSTGVVILIFLYLHHILMHVSEKPLSQNFDFWYLCIQFTYHLGSFGIFLSYNYFTHRYFDEKMNNTNIGSILTYLWIVHNLLLFAGSIVALIGAWWVVRKGVAHSASGQSY